MIKKKILIVSPPLKRIGGVNNYVRTIIKNNKSNENEIKHFSLGVSNKSYNSSFFYFLSPFPWLDILKFNRYIKNSKPDLIHFNPSLMGLFLLFRIFVLVKISKNNNIPILFFVRGWRSTISKLFYSNSFLSVFFKTLFSIPDLIIVLANDFKVDLINLGIPEEKIKVRTTMVKSSDFTTSREDIQPPFQILHSSHLRKEKGIYELLDSVPYVIEKYPDTIFVFLGEIELSQFKSKIKALGLEKNVSCPGYKLGKDKIEIYKKSDIFVLPSYSEGFPNVYCEALAAGLVFIGTPVGGLKDNFVDRKQGLVLQLMPPDPKEISKKIIEIIENPDLMKRISKNNSKEALKKYDIKVVIEDILNIYQDLICTKKS